MLKIFVPYADFKIENLQLIAKNYNKQSHFVHSVSVIFGTIIAI